jgi:hypothetical protein
MEREFDRQAPGDPSRVSALLDHLRGPARYDVVLRMQHRQGNSVVQRLLGHSGPGVAPVQRQQPTDEELDAGAQDATIDPVKLHAENYGVTPDPNDPYEKPPTNWDALSGGAYGPDVPDVWAGVTPLPLAPRPNLKADGKPASNIEPAKETTVNQALTTFEHDLDNAHSSWGGLTTAIRTYAEASHDLEGSGVLGAQGLGWNAGTPDSDMGALTSQQKLGPNNSTTLEDLFKTKGGTAGTTASVDSSGLHETKETKERVVAVNNAKNTLEGSWKTHVGSQINTWGVGKTLSAAIRQVGIVADKVEKDKLEDEKSKLEKEKSEAIESLETFFGGLEASTLISFGLLEAAKDPAAGAESIAIGLEIAAETIRKAQISADFDPKIDALDAKIKSATTSIRAKEATTAQDALKGALAQFAAAKLAEFGTKTRYRQDMFNLQTAYNELAKAAGAQAGGGKKGAQIQAAIEAIPKVDQCLARIDSVLMAIKIPNYSDPSGKGFNGFKKPQDFTQHISWMKGYYEKFQTLRTLWKSRRDSLNTILRKLGPG